MSAVSRVVKFRLDPLYWLCLLLVHHLSRFLERLSSNVVKEMRID